MTTPADALHQRITDLDDLISRLERDEAALRDARGAESADDEHDPEGTTLTGEWQRTVALLAGARASRADAEAALARVDTDAFGVCAACGQEIPAERLAARPDASHCVGCLAASGR